MTCESVKDLLWLADCGELSLDEEELLEQHLEGCRACAAERQRVRRLDALLESQRMEVPAQLLARCRRDLAAKVRAESMPSGLERVSAWWRAAWSSAWWKPAAAMSLLALGFLGGRALRPPEAPLTVASRPETARQQLTEPAASPEAAAAEATEDTSYVQSRPRAARDVVSDQRLRGVLLAAVSSQDPALRLDSIELLRQHCDDETVRRALLDALRNDRSSGVRLKALEALRPYARDPETRSTLARVLLTDNNATVRTQAIDLLTQSRGADVAAALQELLRHEENGYIRERSLNALHAMKASAETF
jgi:hypothetical protein